MKKSAKGFTLIELLAVIVILAIIALIATPIVLNLIDKARKGAAESSAYAYVNAAEKAAVVTLMDNTGVNLGGATCTVQTSTNVLNCASGASSVATLSLDIKGDLPSSGGTITFDENGSVTNASFTINGYGVVVDDKGKATVSTTTATTPTTPSESSSDDTSSEDSSSTSSGGV